MARGVQLLLYCFTSGGELSSLRPGRFAPRERDPVPVVHEAGWTAWTGAKNPSSTGIRSPALPIRSE